MSATITLKHPLSSTKPTPIKAQHNLAYTNNKTIIIFCIDEYPLIHHLVKNMFITDKTVKVYHFNHICEALNQLDLKPEIIILDYGEKSKRSAQEDLIEKAKVLSPLSKLVILSSQREASIAVDCLKKGAIDYILKDEHMKFHLKKAVDNIIKRMEVKAEILLLAQKIKRDKLLLKGYFCVALLSMIIMLTYLF